MDVLVNIIIFILSLGVLVLIHELGHFLTAKAFGVYCREFSIGMGPLLFKFKKKNAETQFSLRAIPIGGFVSMVGEEAGEIPAAGGQEEELSEEDKHIASLPPERRLDGIKRWKRAIIMAAGVTMNLVLAFFLFIGQGVTSLVPVEDRRDVAIVQDGEGLFVENGYVAGMQIVSGEIVYYVTVNEVLEAHTYKDDDIKDGNELVALFGMYNSDLPTTINDYATYKFTCIDEENASYDISFERKAIESESTFTYEGQLGIQFFGRNRNFGEVISFAFSQCGESSMLIFEGLGSLFTNGLENIGGPIAMFEVSSQAVSLGISYYFYLWGMISVNLAVMNFLPFPGLDGWHFVVLIFEGISKREMPAKAKNVASTIGILLLFGLMIVVTIKDIFGLF